jgi:hypothetical protein
MRIVRARLKPFGGSAEFISVKGRIKSLVKNNTGDLFDFVVDVDGVKSVKSYGPDNINPDLVGQEIGIVDDSSFAKFNEDGTIEITFGPESNEGALPQESTVKQLQKIRKISKGTDIGDRISDMNKQGANIAYIHNPVDTGIESYEDFEKKNKSFVPGWNLKHLISPFRGKDHGKKI